MLKYLGFRIAAAIIQRLPERLATSLGGQISLLFYLFNRTGRDAALDNMSHVLGPDASKRRLTAEARRAFRHATLNYVDLLRLPVTSLARLDRDRLLVHGEEHIMQALASGRGIIFCSAHFGSPELTVQALLTRGVRVLALTEPLQPPALSRFIDSLRSSAGHRFASVNYGTLKEALRVLRSGGTVAIMFDRDIQGRSVDIDLCGQPASVPTGAAELALRTGALILPVITHRRVDNKLDVWIEEPLQAVEASNKEAAIRATTEAIFARFLPHLRSDPCQWVVLERVWGPLHDAQL